MGSKGTIAKLQDSTRRHLHCAALLHHKSSTYQLKLCGERPHYNIMTLYDLL